MEQILEIVIQFVVTVLGLLAAAAVNELRNWLSANTSKQDQEYLKKAADLAVQYAEQRGVLEAGQTKYNMALESVEEFLASKGINFTTEQIKTAIESAVFEMNRNKKAIEPFTAGPTVEL